MIALKKPLAALLAVLLLCAPFFSALGESTEQLPASSDSTSEPEPVQDAAVATTPFNIREARDLSSKMVWNVQRGAKLTVTAYYDDGWCRVEMGSKSGYAKISWLNIPGRNAEDLPQVPGDDSVADTDPGTPVYDTEGRGAATPTATEDPVEPSAVSLNPREAATLPEGVSVGESETNELRFAALCKRACSIWSAPSSDSTRVGDLKKGAKLYVLAYGDDWCKILTRNGQTSGYVKSKFVFHYHSMDPFRFPVPGYASFQPTGFITLTQPIRITDRKDLYHGQKVQAGDVVCVRLREDGDYDVLLRRDWVTVPKEYGTYTPFVAWDEAKAGDIVGGFTLFYGIGQGGRMHRGRATNIGIAMRSMDNVVVASGRKYSFLKNLGPLSAKYGYKVAGVIGGNGRGIGGGVCHTSSLTYSAALSLPLYIYEREPHTDDGVFYIPLEFDATVGGWSDFVYYNTLPYDLKHHAFYNAYNGNITLYFECLETLPQSELQSWDWKTLSIPRSKDE